MFFIVLFIWFAFAVSIGAAASERGRNGFGWFVVAFLFSPLVAGVLLIVFPNLKQEQMLQAALERPRQPPPVLPKLFEPDGIFDGVPYRVLDDGSITAILQGATVSFRNFEKFTGAFNRDTRA